MKNTFLSLLLFGGTLYADAEKGKAVYAANCAICHTINGGNALGPDFNIVSYTRTKEEIEYYAKDPYSLSRSVWILSQCHANTPIGRSRV